MLQLENKTPFAACLNLFPDADGIDTLFVVVKGTFSLGDGLDVAEEQVPVQLEDEYYGDPTCSSIRFATEAHLPKPSTDVVLVGSAHAPDGREVKKLRTSLRVGPVSKTIDVVGDRVWTGGMIGSAMGATQPFNAMPLNYERAYGGTHLKNEEKQKFSNVARNPVGQGYHASRRRKEIEGQIAPNLSDPRGAKKPASYGFVSPNWPPRVGHVGTYDEAWQKSRAPYLPTDFDARFFNAAHPDLICPGYLQGGESVELINLSPRGDLRFDLPVCDFDLQMVTETGVETPSLLLETVLFLPDQDQLSLQWRASLQCDKQALKIGPIRLGLRESALVGGTP